MYACLQQYVFQPEYSSLPDAEKVALLERGQCPSTHVLPGCDDMVMNFAMDWNLLQPAMTTAFASLQRTFTMHALDGPALT